LADPANPSLLSQSILGEILGEINLFPRQQELRNLVENSHHKIITLGGSRGGLKSSGIQRVQLIRRCAWPRSRGIIIRRKYKELKENHIDPFFNDFPKLRAYYNVSDKTLTLPNGSALVFWHAETFKDLRSLQGAAFMDVSVDEATHFAQAELEWLLAINRASGDGAFLSLNGLYDLTDRRFTAEEFQSLLSYATAQDGVTDDLCKTTYTCNPGDIGHAYIQRIAVEGTKNPTLYTENEKPSDYAFIQTYGWDNAFWATRWLKDRGLSFDDYYNFTEEQQFEIFTKHTDYGQKLMALPEALRPGWLFGRWDKFAGQYFSNFNRKRHVGRLSGAEIVCEADGKRYRIEPYWPRWISLDWGFADDAAAHWHTTAPDGRHITYREWVVNNVTPRMLGTGLLERSQGETIQQFFLSFDAFDDRTGQSTIAEQIRESACIGNRIPYPAQASKARVSGWQLLYDLFEKDQLLLSEACPVLIAALPTLVRFGFGEPGDVEDIKPSPVDHAPDSLRYGMFSRLGAAQVPVEVRAAEVVKNITNPTMRVLALDKFYADEAKKNQPVPIPRRLRRSKFGF
jgi:hypothetical protein